MEEPLITGIDAYLMIVTAIIIDVIQLIPIVGSLVDIIAGIIFGIWFAHYDMSLIRRRPLGFFGTIIAEFIPFVDWIPFWTFFVIMTIRKEHAEVEG